MEKDKKCHRNFDGHKKYWSVSTQSYESCSAILMIGRRACTGISGIPDDEPGVECDYWY
jgi:hypothetical protein